MKRMQIIISLITVFILINGVFYPVQASSPDDIIKDGRDFISKGNVGTVNKDILDDASETIFNILLAVGTILTVIIGAILGIKYMTGSIEEQAQVKQTLIPFIIGCVVIFGAFTIWSIVIRVTQNVLK